MDSYNFSDLMDYLVRFSTGNFPFSVEGQCFFMAVQGAMMVRKGPNRNGKFHWFHAFVYSVLGGFAGGWLGFVWMGKPSSMLASDINFGSCILAYALVNHTPADLGFLLCNTLPVTLVTTSFAQLFRSLGIIKFIKVCFETFKNNPSPYYPIPVFGPILYATLLGNMGGIVMKGLEGHVENGMPWPVQNGFFCAAFYHFYVNDADGPVGTLLRRSMATQQEWLGFDEDSDFAAVVVTVFMQVMGILQLPEFLGPSFSPFSPPLLRPWLDSSSWEVGKTESAYSHKQQQQHELQQLQQQRQQHQQQQNTSGGGGRRRKNRNRNASKNTGGNKKTN